VTAYATRRDLYTYGLPRGIVGRQGRLVSSSKAATDVLELDGHGFETDDELLLRATEGGTLSAPLAEGTVYYAIRLTDSTFKLAATAGGAAINITSDGVSMVVSTPLPLDEILEVYSRWVDDFLPGHVVPLESPYPVTVVATVAELAAKKIAHLAGVSSESINEAELAAKAKLERWAKGIPLRDTRATASANKAVYTTATGSDDPRGWGSGSLP
jgi:hypothetical protein